jgi:hypothetical protein
MIVFFVQYKERYVLHFKFSSLFNNEIKKIKGFKFNSLNKTWSIPKEYADLLAENLQMLNIETIFDNSEEENSPTKFSDKSKITNNYGSPEKKFKKFDMHNAENNELSVYCIDSETIEIKVPIPKNIYNMVKSIQGTNLICNVFTLKGDQYEELKRLCNIHNIKIIYN